MAVRAKTRKVVIIGAGHVGAHCASSLMNRHLVNEIVFLDMNQEAAHAQVLDLDDLAAIHTLGEGWVAEETLAIAVYCTL